MRRTMVTNSAATARCSGVEKEEEEEEEKEEEVAAAGASTWSEVMRWIRGSVWRRVCSAALRKQVLPRLSRPWRPPRYLLRCYKNALKEGCCRVLLVIARRYLKPVQDGAL